MADYPSSGFQRSEAEEPARPSIAQATEKLDKHLAVLNDIFNVLEERLDPVLAPERERAERSAEAQLDSPLTSSHMADLLRLSSRANGLTDRVNRVIARIEV